MELKRLAVLCALAALFGVLLIQAVMTVLALLSILEIVNLPSILVQKSVEDGAMTFTATPLLILITFGLAALLARTAVKNWRF